MGIDIVTNNPDYSAILYKGMKDISDREASLPGRDVSFTGDQYKTFVDEAVEKLRNAGDLFNKRLDFRVDEATNRIVVKVIDTRTDKVIKEIPPEQLLHLAAKIQEMAGLLVDEER